MSGARRVSGRVVDAEGSPVADAVLAVEWGTAPTPEIGIVSGPDGTFGLALRPGRYRVRASHRGRQGQVELEVGAESVEPFVVVVK